MTGKLAMMEQLEDSGVVAVLRGIDPDQIVPVAEAIHEGGVRALEVTQDARRSADMLADVVAALEETDAVVGAGTVIDEASTQAAIDAGADFVVAPTFEPAVVETCNRHGVLCAPGVMTPTEALEAVEAGADMVKMFPASTVGPGHIGAIRGPLGDLPIMPTGGVDVDNVAEYVEAGATCVGAGSALVNYDAIDADDMDGVRERAAEFVAAVEEARS